MAIRIAAEALNLLTSIVLARIMGVRGYGIYAYALSVITLLSIPTAAGLPTVAVREVAVYRARNQWSLILGLGRWMTRAVLAVSMVVLSVALAVSIVWSERPSTEVRDTVLVGLPLVLLIALAAVQAGRLRGLHHVLLGQLSDRLLVPAFLMTLIGAAAAVVGPDGLDAVAVMTLQVIAVAAALGVASWMLARKTPSPVRSVAPAYEAKRWAGAAIPLLLLDGVVRLNQDIGVVIIGAIGGAEAAGLFRVALRGAEVVAFGLNAIGVAVGPTLARVHAVGDHARLERVVRKAARAALAWGLPVAAVFTIFADAILTRVFGAGFAAGATALAILSLAQLVNVGTGPLGLALTMTGHERFTMLSHATGVVMNVALALALVPAFGTIGAAGAAATSIVARSVLMVVLARRRLGIRVWGA
jgi:O-antigen/teichoic acid export membrane protein